MSEIKTNKISSLDSSNSDITLDPDGTGKTVIQGGDNNYFFAMKGGTYGLRYNSNTSSSQMMIEAVDDTLTASHEPLFIGGSTVSLGIAGSEKVKVDASGNVGIGNASPSHLVDATVSSGSAAARFGTTHNSGDNDGTVIISNGGSGDAMLRFDYEGTNTDRARIGTTSSGQDLKFFTAGDNERMKILASGHVEVGDYDDNGATRGLFIERGATEYAVRTSTTLTSSRIHYDFRNTNGRVGSIATSGSSTSYSESSDHRLKENVVAMTGAITRLKALAPKRFNFIVDPDTTVDGFIAHEAQTVVPEAVTGTHNEVDDDGNAVMQGIDKGKLVPLLTGALQEAIAKIEALETENSTQATQIADLITRVTALENA